MTTNWSAVYSGKAGEDARMETLRLACKKCGGLQEQCICPDPDAAVESPTADAKFHCSKCGREIAPVVKDRGRWRHVWGEMEEKDFEKLETLGCFDSAQPVESLAFKEG